MANWRACSLAAVLVGGLMALSGCAETALTVNTVKSLADSGGAAADKGRYKIGRPYEIAGRWYTPHEDFEYDEIGMASWYGPKFHGKHTANGERFDQNALTAAHRTLPMPSMVRVTNMENGRTVDLRVNDRGPFARDRILDVSKRAAELLGFRRNGTARVRVVILPEESIALRNGLDPDNVTVQGVRIASTEGTAFVPVVAPPGVNDGTWHVQAGAFTDFGNANQVAAVLSRLGPTRVSTVLRDGRQFARVRLGPLADGAEAARLLRAVQASGYPDARLVSN
jgi:rare lipoprotein A